MKLGDKIKLLRNKKGLTQLSLANKSNISRSYLADVERNRYNPSIDTLKAIATALDTSLSNLICDTDTDMNISELKKIKSSCMESNNVNLEEMIFDFEKGLENVVMKNGKKLDERTKELFKQSLRNVYDFIAPEDKNNKD